jgi:toxin ParE1/3/4
MDYRVIWTQAALADLRDLVRYIARDDQKVAKQFGELIIGKISSIQAFPRMGRMVPEYREDYLRELIVSPYRIVYEIDDEKLTLAVLRIWHAARGRLELPM